MENGNELFISRIETKGSHHWHSHNTRPGPGGVWGGVKRIFVTPKMTLSIMKQHSTNKLKTLSDNYKTHNSNHLTQHLKH